MKLIGRDRLMSLIRTCARLRGDVLALQAELEAAAWRSPDDVMAAFPKAETRGHSLVIGLDAAHCVELTINYQAGIALVDHAGRRLDRATARGERRGKDA